MQTQPELLKEVRDAIENIAEAEVMAQNEQGKLVVVLDTQGNRQAADTITAIQNTAGVLSATLHLRFVP